MDSDGRHCLMASICNVAAAACLDGAEQERQMWWAAALQKRIKVRRRRGLSRVEIIPAT